MPQRKSLRSRLLVTRRVLPYLLELLGRGIFRVHLATLVLPHIQGLLNPLSIADVIERNKHHLMWLPILVEDVFNIVIARISSFEFGGAVLRGTDRSDRACKEEAVVNR